MRVVLCIAAPPHLVHEVFMHWLFCHVVQTVVTNKPANSNCLLVTLYVLFEPVRFFGVGCFFPSLCGAVHCCSPHLVHEVFMPHEPMIGFSLMLRQCGSDSSDQALHV